MLVRLWLSGYWLYQLPRLWTLLRFCQNINFMLPKNTHYARKSDFLWQTHHIIYRKVTHHTCSGRIHLFQHSAHHVFNTDIQLCPPPRRTNVSSDEWWNMWHQHLHCTVHPSRIIYISTLVHTMLQLGDDGHIFPWLIFNFNWMYCREREQVSDKNSSRLGYLDFRSCDKRHAYYFGCI